MLCENCHKKQAIMHMVCLMGDKQVDRWLCEDCATEFLPAGLGLGAPNLTPEQALGFFKGLMQDFGKPRKKVTKEGFTAAAARILQLAANKALDCGSGHIGTEHILAGLLAADDCSGKKILRRLHDNLDEIAGELESWLDKGA